MKKFIAIVLSIITLFAFVGCNAELWTEADKVNSNLNKEADYFNCERKIIVLSIITLFAFAGCNAELWTEADKVNSNLNKEADYFNCERKITVYNARTDNIILEIEGFMSLSNNSANELVVTCKTGANEYKKNYVYLNDYTLYVVEDITGTHTDPYHYQLVFHTEFPLTVETRP